MFNYIQFLITIVTLSLLGCTSEVTPIRYGKDLCEHCGMVIMDEKFGSKAQNPKGKLYAFDSDECLIEYLADKNASSFKGFWVVDYKSPTKLIPVQNAYFAWGGKIVSPMGGKLASFSSEKEAKSYADSNAAQTVTWETLLKEFGK